MGIAVADLDVAVAAYERLTGSAPAHRQVVASDGIEAVMFEVGESRIELLGSTGPESKIAGFLAKRGERPPSRRLRGRRRPGQPRSLRRAGSPAPGHVPASGRRRPAGGVPPSLGGERGAHRAVPAGPGESRVALVSDQPGAAPGSPAETESGIPIEPFYVDQPDEPPPPGEFPYTGASVPTATGRGCGRCASTPGSAAPSRPTSGFTICCAPGRAGSRWRSTCRPRWATTATTRWRTARSARSAWPSTPSRTWSC